MPTCRELLHLPTSHANLSRVTSESYFTCQMDEPREAQYMAGVIALQMSRMWGMFEAGEKRTIDAALGGTRALDATRTPLIPKKGVPEKKGKGVLWQSLTSLDMQPGAKLRRISRGLILQPHACTQRFRIPALNSPQVEYNPFGKPCKERASTQVVHKCHLCSLNPHSLRAPCYMCYMCYILHAKPPNPGPCYMYYMRSVRAKICSICAI